MRKKKLTWAVDVFATRLQVYRPITDGQWNFLVRDLGMSDTEIALSLIGKYEASILIRDELCNRGYAQSYATREAQRLTDRDPDYRWAYDKYGNRRLRHRGRGWRW